MELQNNKKRWWIILTVTVILIAILALFGERIFYQMVSASIKMPEELPETRDLSETLTREQAEQDVNAVFSTISKNHKMRERDPAAFKKVEEQYKQVLSQLYDGMTIREEWILVSELEHELKDAHSCVRLNFHDKEKLHYIGPVFEADDARGLWYQEEGQRYRLLAVNGVSADEIYENARKRLAYENIYWLSAVLEKQLSDAENMQLLGIPYQEDAVSVAYERAGEEFVKNLPYCSYEQAYPEEAVPYSAEYDEALSLAVFTLNEMMYTDEYFSFVSDFLDEVKDRGIQNLVLDLRNDGGGNSRCGEPFTAFLTKDFEGRAYALVSHKTFSSGVLFTLALRQSNAVLVGEQTGGSPNSYGEVRNYTMPNSHLLYRVTQKYFSSGGGSLDTVTPHVLVDEKQALDRVKEMIREDQAAFWLRNIGESGLKNAGLWRNNNCEKNGA